MISNSRTGDVFHPGLFNKDAQIADKDAQIADKDAQIAELSARLASLEKDNNK